MSRIPLACGLYSVHKDLAADLEGTIKKVAEIGYEGVEFYSGVQKDADRINAILSEAGVKVVGWHSSIDDLLGDTFDKTVAFHKAIGNTAIVIPGLPAAMTANAAAWHETAKLFKELAAKLKPHGITIGYHNHAAEFKPLDNGELAWDIMGVEAGEDVVLQLDNGNALSGGADTIALLKKYPNRCKTIHLKPYSVETGFSTMIGNDSIPWAETFAEIEAQGVTDWYIVEYEDEKTYAEMDGVRVCYEKLKEMGK